MGLLLLAAVSACAGQPSATGEEASDLNRAAAPSFFKEVEPGVYRGNRPDAATLRKLAALGVKFDLDLEDAGSAITSERPVAQAAGLTFISKPMSGFWTPDDAQVDSILSVVSDPQQRPIFIHCQHGQDRTGLIVGLYRVFYESWEPAAAYQEMLDNGFHQILVLLNHYYEEKTGFED
jgi:tyrosine-protein phosphatase SIW14